MVIVMVCSISFKEIAKLIHPDSNPDISDPGAKMAHICRFKDKGEYLYRLGVKWGVITDAPKKDVKPKVLGVGSKVFVITRNVIATIDRMTAKTVFFTDGGVKSKALIKNIRLV